MPTISINDMKGTVKIASYKIIRIISRADIKFIENAFIFV